MSFFKKWIQDIPQKEESSALTAVVEKLKSLNTEDAEFLSSFAFILARVAYADMEMSSSEKGKITEVLQSMGKMSDEHAKVVVDLVGQQSYLFGNTENYTITRDFGLSASHEEKINLLKCLFAVSAADDSISSAEEKELKLISSELKVSDEEFVEVRAEYRQYREVLKGL